MKQKRNALSTLSTWRRWRSLINKTSHLMAIVEMQGMVVLLGTISRSIVIVFAIVLMMIMFKILVNHAIIAVIAVIAMIATIVISWQQ